MEISAEDFHNNPKVYEDTVRKAREEAVVFVGDDGRPVGTMGEAAVKLIPELIAQSKSRQHPATSF